MAKGSRLRADREVAKLIRVTEDLKPHQRRKLKKVLTEPPPQIVEPTPTKPGWMCRVRGCESLALERHETPDGDAYLCGNCGRIARHNLLLEELKERFTEQVAALHVPTLEAYERRRAEHRERQEARAARRRLLRPSPGDVLEATSTRT
jgi:hypothetical protein